MKPFCHGIAFSGGELLLGNVTNLVRPVARRLKSGRDFRTNEVEASGKDGSRMHFFLSANCSAAFSCKTTHS